MNDALRTFLCGVGMGAADVVPGVSGGTVAFITGIYDRLLGAIKSFGAGFFRDVLTLKIRSAVGRIPWGFLIPLVCGIGLSIFSLAKAVIWLLKNQPVLVWSFFTGLILASILMFFADIRTQLSGKAGAAGRSGPVPCLAAFAAGTVFALFLSFAPHATMPAGNIGIFLSGFIAMCAMILPGISGSFMLVLLGQYAVVIGAVASLNIPLLAIFASGGICGLLSFARLLSLCLDRFRAPTLSALTGMMAGSLPVVWPFKADGFPVLPDDLSMLPVAVAAAAVGAALPFALQMIAARAKRS